MDDAVFAVDLVRCAGEELARRFLAHHIFLAGGFRGDLVGGVGLAEAELESVSSGRGSCNVSREVRCLPASTPAES